MNESTKTAVLERLSEAVNDETKAEFKEALVSIMEYQPKTVDRATFLKLTLPIFVRAYLNNPDRYPTMSEYAAKACLFIDSQTMMFITQNPISPDEGIDAEAAWMEKLAMVFGDFTPFAER